MTSYDVIGDIAIIEGGSKEDAGKIMKNSRIRVVCMKASEREGTLRLRKLEIVAGERRTETTHVEYGCRFKVDVAKAYFSPREMTERQRIARFVREGESVLVMFSGIGAMPIIIAKAHKDVRVVGVELNRDAHFYAEENSRLNRVGDRVSFVCGDVRDVSLNGRFDRIAMPLPKGAEDFLDVALKWLAPGGTIHFYQIAQEGGEEDVKKRVMAAAQKAGRKTIRVGVVKVLPYAPRTWKFCADATIA